jgi:hypothetical protein
MQSTGVYWIPLYEILEERGLEVYLVNARHTKNLPGRKSDVQESQWLLKLHTYGLLNNSFQPISEIRVLRTYWRQRLLSILTACVRLSHSASCRRAQSHDDSRFAKYQTVTRVTKVNVAGKFLIRVTLFGYCRDSIGSCSAS